MAGVTFREAALVDLDRHDTWRASLESPAPPIAEEIVAAVLGKLLDLVARSVSLFPHWAAVKKGTGPPAPRPSC